MSIFLISFEFQFSNFNFTLLIYIYVVLFVLLNFVRFTLLLLNKKIQSSQQYTYIDRTDLSLFFFTFIFLLFHRPKYYFSLFLSFLKFILLKLFCLLFDL